MIQADVQRLAMPHLSMLCETIGPRPVGHANNLQAQAYIGGVFHKLGLATQTQPFGCMGWSSTPPTLRVGPWAIPARVSPYSLGINYTGPYAMADSVGDLSNLALSGKALVLHGDLASEPLMPKNFVFWNPDRHREIIHLLEGLRPKAIIALTDTTPSPLIEDGDFDIPVVAVSRAYYDIFLRDPNQPLSLAFSARRVPAVGANVIARHNPTQAIDVVVCAHLDTKPNTPGALDNASGIATMLVAAQIVCEMATEASVAFVALNGEDYYSTPGQRAFMAHTIDEMAATRLAINCDGVGYVKGKTHVAPMGVPAPMAGSLAQHIANYPSLALGPPWPQGDHMMFVNRRIPALAITSAGIFDIMGTIIHTEKDMLPLVDPNKVVETAMLAADLIQSLGCDGTVV